MQALRSAPERLPKTHPGLTKHVLASFYLYNTRSFNIRRDRRINPKEAPTPHPHIFLGKRLCKSLANHCKIVCTHDAIGTPPRRNNEHGLLPVSPTATLSFHNIKRPEKSKIHSLLLLYHIIFLHSGQTRNKTTASTRPATVRGRHVGTKPNSSDKPSPKTPPPATWVKFTSAARYRPPLSNSGNRTKAAPCVRFELFL